MSSRALCFPALIRLTAPTKPAPGKRRSEQIRHLSKPPSAPTPQCSSLRLFPATSGSQDWCNAESHSTSAIDIAGTSSPSETKQPAAHSKPKYSTQTRSPHSADRCRRYIPARSEFHLRPGPPTPPCRNSCSSSCSPGTTTTSECCSPPNPPHSLPRLYGPPGRC